MKAFSAGVAPKVIDRPTAWACLVTNLTTLPGLGSLAAGRRIGYAQAAVALTGFGLSLLWMVLFVLDWRAEGAAPFEWRPSLWVGIAGVALFGAGWLWALTTSRALLRAAQANENSSGADLAQRVPPILDAGSPSGPAAGGDSAAAPPVLRPIPEAPDERNSPPPPRL